MHGLSNLWISVTPNGPVFKPQEYSRAGAYLQDLGERRGKETGYKGDLVTMKRRRQETVLAFTLPVWVKCHVTSMVAVVGCVKPAVAT